ncbi:MAG: hypothetical protein GY710_02060 [Desulfobacteraceae bacterium]|nr:hypothetical protein [Desulfobacteraceae bacterium]
MAIKMFYVWEDYGRVEVKSANCYIEGGALDRWKKKKLQIYCDGYVAFPSGNEALQDFISRQKTILKNAKKLLKGGQT